MVGGSEASCPASAAGSVLSPTGTASVVLQEKGGREWEGLRNNLSISQAAGRDSSAALPTAWKARRAVLAPLQGGTELGRSGGQPGAGASAFICPQHPEAPGDVLMMGRGSGRGCKRNFFCF